MHDARWGRTNQKRIGRVRRMMTKRQRLIQNVRFLYFMAKKFDADKDNYWGIQTMTVHLRSGSHNFRTSKEARDMAKQMIRSFKGKRT